MGYYFNNPTQITNKMVDFSNTEIAFKSKSDTYLKKSKILFSIMKHGGVVTAGKHMYNIAKAVHFPTNWAIRPTVYEHFVGGANLNDCTECVKDLLKFKVKSILDYSAEGAAGEDGIKRSFDETIRSIENAGKMAGVAYAVFKPSAMSYPHVLEKVALNQKLSNIEQHQYKQFIERLDAFAKRSYELGVRLLVDAEHYAYQKTIDDVTDMLMEKYNKERVVVFNTLQMYRHDRMEYLRKVHAIAKERGFKVGEKFVRGAYMEHERARAAQKGYIDPICKNKQATDDNFNEGIAYCIEHIDDFEVFCGTHNAESCQKLIELINKFNIAKDDQRIYFSQLYGMSDNLTYNLAEGGYNAVKYIPYAPIGSVMPYLIRRAEENTSIAGQTNRELELLESELKRRKDSKKR